MRAAWLARGLWGVALMLTTVTILSLRRTYSVAAPAVAPTMPSLGVSRPTPDSLELAVEVAIEGNLFRADRTPLGEEAAPVAAESAPRAPRPQLTLRGLIGGPSWQAIIEGIPGVEGAVVLRPSEAREGITVKAIRRDTVFLTSKDTAWKLTVRRQ